MTSFGSGSKKITIERVDGKTLDIFGEDVSSKRAEAINLKVNEDPRKLLLWLQESPGWTTTSTPAAIMLNDGKSMFTFYIASATKEMSLSIRTMTEDVPWLKIRF